MKVDKIKHNHSLTKLLKVFIFSIVMLIPAFSVASRCLYVICNKNAYQSYSGTQQGTLYERSNKYNSNEVNSANDLVIDNIYQPIDMLDTTSFDNEGAFYVDLYLIDGEINNTVADSVLEETSDLFYNTQIYISIEHVLNNNDNYTTIKLNAFNGDGYLQIDLLDFGGDFIVQYTYGDGDLELFSSYFDYTDYNEYTYTLSTTSTLDNVFEYSIQKLGQSEYLAWTQNTAIYTGINTMNTQLGITMPTYSMVLTYWFFMIVIYVIIDIILGIFTTLTHMLGKKIE